MVISARVIPVLVLPSFLIGAVSLRVLLLPMFCIGAVMFLVRLAPCGIARFRFLGMALAPFAIVLCALVFRAVGVSDCCLGSHYLFVGFTIPALRFVLCGREHVTRPNQLFLNCRRIAI